MKTRFLPLILLSALASCARGEVLASTGAFRLDLRASPRTVAAGATELLAYSTRWDGGDAVAISLDGAAFGSCVGEGTAGWTPTASGLFSFEHSATSNGVAVGETLSASFLVGSLVPQNLRASDGTSPDHVEVEWDAIVGATYELFRSETNDFAYAVSIGTTNEPAWFDSTATPGETYWYWVKAVAGTRVSDPSASDDGWRATAETLVGVWKEWDDNGNEAGYRPDSVAFTLYDEGLAVATTNLSVDSGWIAVWSVPGWRNGERIAYSVTEDDVPRAYETSVATNGLDTLRRAKLNGTAWTENGWQTLRHANINTSIWTTNGWEVLRHAKLDTLVQTVDRSRGTMFAVTNRFVAPTDPVPVDVAGWTGVYDGNGHGVSVSSTAPGATIAYARSENGPYAPTKPLFTNVVDGARVWIAVAAPYFVPVTNSATVTITQRPITVTADAKSKVFGTADPPLSYTVSSGSLVAGDSIAGALAREPGEAVGTYAIQQGTLSAGANYALSYTGADFTITRATIVVDGGESGTNSPASYVGVYDGEGHGISVSVTTPAMGATVMYALSEEGPFGETNPLFTNVVDHAAVWYVVEAANYTAATNWATVTITNRPLWVAADAKTKVYGTADPPLTYAVSNLVAGDLLSGAIVREPGEAVGTYAIQQGTLSAGANYALSYTGADFTITKAAIVVDDGASGTNSPASYVGVYDGEGHGVSVSVTTPAEGATVTYSLSADGPFNETNPLFTNVVDHAAVWYVVEAANYAAATNWATVTITNRPLWVSADAKTKVYGTADPPLTYAVSNLVAGDLLSGAIVREPGEAVGTYAIQQGTLSAGANYALSYTGADFTITRATIVVDGGESGTNSPASYVGVYDGEGHGISVSVTTPTTGATVTYALSEDGPFSATNPLFTNVVDHAAVWYVVEAANYAAATNWATVTITNRPLWVAADPKTKVYGAADPELTCSVSNLVAGDVVSGALSRQAGENVGTYPIELGTLTAGPNYAIQYMGADLTITAATVTVRAHAKTKIYGDEDPELTYSIEGLAEWDDESAVEAVLLRAPGENVGFYDIFADDVFFDSNYAYVFVGAQFAITPRPIAVTADPKTKVFGTADPELTYAVSNLVAGETLSGSLSREAGEDVGTYAIGQGTLTGGANYAISYTGADFTITRATIVVDGGESGTNSPASYVGVYDGEGHGISVSVTTPSEGAMVTYALSEEGPFTATNPLFTNVVDHAAVRYAVEAANYATATNWATVTITNRPLWVAADPKTKVFGAADPELTCSVSNLVAGDVVSGALLREAGENVGTYAINQGTLTGGANYAISYTGADFTITRATIVIDGGESGTNSPASYVGVYDGEGHGISVSVTTPSEGATVTYALSEDGPFSAANPLFTNVVDHAAVWYAVEAANYATATNWATVTITNRPLWVAADPKTKVFGTADPELTGSVSNLVAGDVVSGALLREAGEDVGIYAIEQGTLTATPNYAVIFTGANFTITKGTIPGTDQIQWNVAADAATFLYDGAGHGVALTGLPAGVTATYAGNVATNAGNYTATAHLVYDTANYETVADPAPLAWSISKRPITLMAASKEKPYDGWPLEVKPEDITVAGSGYAPGECFAYGDYASITDVGEIPATFSYADSATAKVANYDVTVQGGQTLKITVGGDQISVTADSAVWAYDGETHRKESWTFVNGDKLLGGHVFDIAISTNSAVATPAEGIVSNAFDHVKIVEESSGRDMTRNYNLFVYEGTLQVTNAPIGPTMALDRTVEAIYDGQAHSAAVEAPTLLQPATVRYRVGDGAWTAEAPSWTHAGTYTAEFEVSAQFYDPATGTVQVAISPRPVTLASPTKSKPYDGTALTFAADEIAAAPGGSLGELAPPFPAGESFVYSGFASITDAGRTDAAFAWAAGAGTLAADYDVTVEKGTLTVTRNAEEITVTAKSAIWVYDGETHALHEWTAENLGALVAGDALDVAFDPASAIAEPGETTNRIVSVKVMRGEADVTANYTLSWWPGTLKVTKAAIGPKMEGISTTATAVYDGAGHAATVAAPTLLTAPVAVQYAATADGPWGAAPVAFTNAGSWTAFFRVEAPHYEPYVGTSTMTISPREVTLVSAGATKVYDGTPLGKDEVSVKEGSLSFAAGEGFTATCSGTITDVGGVENVFEYTLKANTKADNYTIRKEYGWLRVTPATLDIDDIGARASWRGPYDGAWHGINVVAPVPRAVVTYAPESGNEEAYGSTNPTWKNVSSNTVFFKILAPNYEPGYGSATVVITKRTLKIKADPKSKIFGTADPTLTYTVENLVAGDQITGKLSRVSGEEVGTYAIRKGNLSAGGNYTISFTGATFEITPGGIVVDASAGALGYAGEYDGEEHGAVLRVKNPATGATVKWAETSAGPWLDASPTFVDAGTNTVWWRVSAPNFETVSGTAPVIIAPRPISKASVGNLTNEWYTGYPVEPVPSVTDTVPITTNDWSVAWEDNIEVGTARAIVTGKRNYTGIVVREFQIVLKPIVVIVIDLSNVEVGQGKWGTASLTTNGIPVNVAAGSRVELELPQGTPVALSFTPNAGFKIGSVIVDRRTWTTQSEWAFEAKADRAFQASYIPNPQTTVAWKLHSGVTRSMMHLSFPVYPGYEEALSDLKFLFADRFQNGDLYCSLFNENTRWYADETVVDGKTYRFVALDASKMAGLAAGTRVVYGVSDSTLANGDPVVPRAEQVAGLYVKDRISPVSGQETGVDDVKNFIGAFSWETNGKTYYQPVGAGYANGVIAEKILDAKDLDAAEALGFDPAFLAIATPSCRFTDFAIDPFGGISGSFEIYAATSSGIEAVSSGTTAKAIFHLWGKQDLRDEWAELKAAEFPSEEDGVVDFFDTAADLGDARFFRVTIEVKATYE